MTECDMLIALSTYMLLCTHMKRSPRCFVSTWKEFESLHGRMIKDSSKYEFLFFEEVLCKVPNLRPEMVIPQYRIHESQLNNRWKHTARYIDFVIFIDGKPKIALEVDGYDKTGSGTGMSEDQLNDFLHRQNEIMLKGMTLLRFFNKSFSKRPFEAINQIESAIDRLTTELSGNVLANGVSGIFSFVAKQAQIAKDAFEISYNANRKKSEEDRQQVLAAIKAKYGVK